MSVKGSKSALCLFNCRLLLDYRRLCCAAHLLDESFSPLPSCPKGFSVFWWGAVGIHQETRAAYWIAGLSPSSPCPHYMFHFQLLCSRFFTQADVRGTAAEVRSAGGKSEARRGGDTDSVYRSHDAFVCILWTTHSVVDLAFFCLRVDVDGRFG